MALFLESLWGLLAALKYLMWLKSVLSFNNPEIQCS